MFMQRLHVVNNQQERYLASRAPTYLYLSHQPLLLSLALNFA